MITLDSISENIIAELIVAVLAFVFSKFFPSIFSKDKTEGIKSKFDMLELTIFLTSIALLNLILNLSFWNKQELTILFTLLSIAFGVSAGYIFQNQCPSCKKFIGAKKRVDEKIIKEFNKEFTYQPMKVWKYSNGNIMKKEPYGNKKIRTEKWQTKQFFYECNHCKHHWDSGQVDVPISIEKEAHVVINTNKQDPNEPSVY